MGKPKTFPERVGLAVKANDYSFVEVPPYPAFYRAVAAVRSWGQLRGDLVFAL